MTKHLGIQTNQLNKLVPEMGSNANTFVFKCILNTFEKYLHLNFSNKKYLHLDLKNFSNTFQILLK